MAKGNNEAKIKFSAETQEFNAAIKKANASLGTLGAELKLNATEMKGLSDTTDKLAERKELLATQLEAAETKTEALRQKMAAAERIYGKNSDEVQRLQKQVALAATAEEQIRQALTKVNVELSEQAEAGKDTRSELAKLEDTIAAQEKTISELKREYAETVLVYGDTSEEAKRVAREIRKLSTNLNDNRRKMADVEKATDKLGKSMTDLADESDEAETELDKLEKTISSQEDAVDKMKRAYSDAVLTYGKNSKEARTLQKNLRTLGSELNDNRNKMSKVETAADKLVDATQDAGEAAEEASDGFTVWKGTLADLASSGIQNVLSGVQGLASSFWNLGDETRELRTNLGKVEVAFSNSGLSAEQASDTYEDFYAIVADEGQATEAVAHLAKIADSQEDLTEWTTIATGVYATFGDSLPLEGLTEAANETIKVGKVTGSLADALNWSTMSSEEWEKAFTGHPKALKKFQKAIKEGLPVEDAFNEALTKCTTESEREQVIRQALTGLYGEAAAAYAETNGSIMEANEAQANYNNALAGLGEIIEPIKTAFTNGMATMLESVTELFKGMDTEAIKAMIADAFDYINDTVFPAIKEGIQWFIDNKDLVIAGLTAIVAGIAAFKIVSLVQTAIGIFKGFQAATEGLTLAQKAMNLVMKMNPIGLIIALVIALVAAFIYLWNNCEWFREFWIGLWDTIKEYVGIAVDWLVNFFTVTIPEAWNTFATFASELWTSITTTISTAAAAIWTSVSTWFTQTWTSVTECVSGIWTSVTTWFSNIWTSVTTTVSNIWTSVVTWFTNIWTSLTGIVSNIWTSVTGYFTSLWQSIVSIFTSLKSSATSAWNNIKTAITTKVTNIWTTVTSRFTSLKSSISEIWTNIKTTISNAITGAEDKVVGVATNIWTNVKTAFTGLKTSVTSIFGNIKDSIIDKIDAAKTKVKGIVDSIVGFFTGAKFSWPSIPMPKFAITPSGWKIGDLLKGSIPKLSIKWNAKGGIVDAPTIFGATGNTLLGAGEAGAEAIAPIDVLLGYVREAVQDVFSMMVNKHANAESYVDKLESYMNANSGINMAQLVDAIEDLANRAVQLNVNGHKFAEATASDTDNVSGNRLNLRNRGLAL